MLVFNTVYLEANYHVSRQSTDDVLVCFETEPIV